MTRKIDKSIAAIWFAGAFVWFVGGNALMGFLSLGVGALYLHIEKARP